MNIDTFSSTIRRKEMDAVLTCMVEEKLGPGDLNARFLQKIKEFFGVSGGVALRSPAIALKHALHCLDLPAQTKVMVSALASEWQYSTLIDLGYEPFVLDVSRETGLVTVEAVSTGMQQGGRVLLLDEGLGNVPDLVGLKATGIPIVEVISQNAGAKIGDSFCGTVGVFSILGLEARDMITAGGGAVLMAGQSRDWAVLRKRIETISILDLLPDINSALAFIQLKELPKNEEIRKKIHAAYTRSLMQGRNKLLVCPAENAEIAVYSYPVVLNGNYKDVKHYALKKDIHIQLAYENSIIGIHNETFSHLIHAQALFLRCVLFPLYPRLGNKKVEKITRVLATLP